MQQTAYMGVTNVYKKLPYLGGICKLWFVPVQEVASIPGINPANQYLFAEPVLKDGKQWRGPVPVPDTYLGVTETQKNDDRGTYYEVKLQAQAPGDAPQSRINYDNMAYNRFLVVGKLRAGGFYILLGSLDSPLDFDTVYSNGPGANADASTKVAFSGESMYRALVMPSFGGDDSGYIFPGGLDGGSVPPAYPSSNDMETIYIVNENSKSIAWNLTRINRFGLFPVVEVWLQDEAGILYLAAIQPTVDAAPPDFTQMDFEFTGLENGFIIIK